MLYPSPYREFIPCPAAVADDAAAQAPATPEFVLPVLTRSAILLNLLLQDDAVDLELASCVVALDAGLAFSVLQLGNAIESGGSISQPASALVAAGREALQKLLECAPRVESQPGGKGNGPLPGLAMDAVVRASLAHLLGRELGKCNPKKCYLGGLLFQVPAMVAATAGVNDGYQGRLISVMCNSLPAALVKAAMWDVEKPGWVQEPLIATILLAEALLSRKNAAGCSALGAAPLWSCWPELDRDQRSALIDRCCELGQWARTNLLRIDPWEFMSRLERRNPWE